MEAGRTHRAGGPQGEKNLGLAVAGRPAVVRRPLGGDSAACPEGAEHRQPFSTRCAQVRAGDAELAKKRGQHVQEGRDRRSLGWLAVLSPSRSPLSLSCSLGINRDRDTCGSLHNATLWPRLRLKETERETVSQVCVCVPRLRELSRKSGEKTEDPLGWGNSLYVMRLPQNRGNFEKHSSFPPVFKEFQSFHLENGRALWKFE